MAKSKAPLEYAEFLLKFPDWVLVSAGQYALESTPELTERSRRRQKEIVGTFLKFLQDNELVRSTLHNDPLNIPDTFVIYLKDVKPEGLKVFREGYLKWLSSLDRDVNSDTSDTKFLAKALASLQKKAP
ncbi:hypothetical protein [Variovorax paradoxus]|uniref:hypothetical protein n=1 Tax=Variovorax paradoxus TaxID=34073 RepID=UPI003D65053C